MAEISPPIVAVLGRGLETATSQFPGTVRRDSVVSGDGYMRAITAARYVADHPEVERVLFSGEYTFALDPAEVPEHGTEASAMELVAVAHGLPDQKSEVLSKARSTYGNWLEIQEMVPADAHIGIVAQENHAPRAVKIGCIVMPAATITTIIADNPPRDNYRNRPTINDRLSSIIYSVYMAGVTPGDIADIQKRDERVQRHVRRVQKMARTLSGLLTRRGPATSSASVK